MNNHKCRFIKHLKIVEADISAYNSLSRYHYRQSRLGPYKKIFAINMPFSRGGGYFGEWLGVIVYSMPSINLQLRNVATNGRYNFAGDALAKMQAINRDFICISRVIIEPRLRGLGLGSWLVSETLKLAETKYVEALAIMGHVNPFFEKAGMTKFEAPMHTRCVRLKQAISAVGIENEIMLSPETVQNKINELNTHAKAFIEIEMQRFLQPYGKKVKTKDGIERTRYALSRLTHRPAYFIYKNPGYPPARE